MLYKSGNFTHRELGEMFGVKHAAITSVLVGRTWKHV